MYIYLRTRQADGLLCTIHTQSSLITNLHVPLTVRKVLCPCCSRTNPVLLSLIQLGPCKISRLSIVHCPFGERFNSEVLRTSLRRFPVITANRSDSSSVNANVVTLVSEERLLREKRIGHTAYTEWKRNHEQLAFPAKYIDSM